LSNAKNACERQGTAKELDEETGLYYYGARYLDPKYSMWLSTDPALGEYIPQAPVNEEAKRYNQNLPGMGGVFNHINSNLYHYAGNNPIKYTDPDGRYVVFKLEENGRYGLGSYYRGFGNCFLLTKYLSNFIPFGSAIVNLQKPLINIDPTSNFDVLFDSDSDYSIVTASNVVDSFGFSSFAESSKIFKLGSNFLSILGINSVINDFVNDKKIEKFMLSLEIDPFRGCLSDGDAITLGNYLAAGALYYYENEARMKQNGISETNWAEKIRNNTNNIFSDAKKLSFDELEK